MDNNKEEGVVSSGDTKPCTFFKKSNRKGGMARKRPQKQDSSDEGNFLYHLTLIITFLCSL